MSSKRWCLSQFGIERALNCKRIKTKNFVEKQDVTKRNIGNCQSKTKSLLNDVLRCCFEGPHTCAKFSRLTPTYYCFLFLLSKYIVIYYLNWLRTYKNFVLSYISALFCSYHIFWFWCGQIMCPEQRPQQTMTFQS